MATSNGGADLKMSLDDALGELGAQKDRAIDTIRRTADDLAERLKLAHDARELLPFDVNKADHMFAFDFDIQGGEIPAGNGSAEFTLQGYGYGGRASVKTSRTVEVGSYRAIVIVTKR